MWLLLGAIINPNFFLVYATSVVTLITFVTSKKKSFDEIYKGGLDMIKEVLLKEYTYFYLYKLYTIKIILNKLKN